MLASEKLLELFHNKQGLVRYTDVSKAGIHPRELSKLTKLGQIERVQRGIYRLVNTTGFDNDWLLEINYRVPKGVFCLLTAMDYHNLSTFIPNEIHLALPTGSYLAKFDYPKVKLHQFSKQIYNYGIEEHKTGPGSIKVYSVEKTLADLLRFQKRYGLELFLESLKSYWQSPIRSVPKLLEAAEVCGVARSMSKYITVIAA